jgi:two-component system, OmpR family, copper resistance phosphate regulon response regulator CusR
MRILVIEDEIKAAAYLRKGLVENGFSADIAHSGADGLHLALSEEFDLVVLDIMMPGMDGWEVLEGIRRADLDVPVIILSACDTVRDRVRGLELGADDYLVKPFAFSELLARIRTILRRGPSRMPEILRISDLEVDLLRHKARRGGSSIDLTAKEFLLLSLMARRRGEVLSRTLIAEQVWGINFDTDTNIVDVAVRRLRRKMDDPFPVKLVHTVRGVGYVLDDA